MSDYLELKAYSSDEAFKSCENLLLKDSVLNDDVMNDCLTEYDVSEGDQSIHELVEVLSNSNSPNQTTDFLQMSLDDIPLMDTNSIDLSDILPQNIPDNMQMLFKIPEHQQKSTAFNDIMNINLDDSILNEIEKAMKGHNLIFLKKPAEEPIEIIRRAPLQLVQQVIKFPAVKNARINKAAEDLKAANKRKQYFQFPREDGVEFYSDDDDNNENNENQPITVNDDGPSPPKKAKLEEAIIEQPIEIPHESPKTEKKKPQFVIQNCPRCDKSFKKLSMHKCRDPVENNGPIKKLKPSDIPLPLKCDSCKAFFNNQEALDKHQTDKHSHLTCKVCKKVMKNAQGLKIHSAKCGIDIQPVKKFVPRYDRNKK